MEQAKTLLRTAVRTFFNNPKQILILDALLLHSVLHADDLAILLTSQIKDIRALLNPLKAARLISSHLRSEARVGSTRPTPREYYYVPFHPAVDSIKYRVAKLRRKVAGLYQEKESKRKDWRCPRCRAEYEELEILDKMGDQGFYCERCGSTLVQNVTAAEDNSSHEKLRRLNTQLAKFDEMIAKVDHVEVPENDFYTAWERRKEVPRGKGTGYAPKTEYVEVRRDEGQRNAVRRQEQVDAKALGLNISSGAQREREMEEERARRKKELAKQNAVPVWHAQSAIGPANGAAMKTEGDEGRDTIKKEELGVRGDIGDEDENEEKKVNVEEEKMRDEVAAYMAEMERERLERERAEQEESDQGDEEDEFEDVDFASTPMSSSNHSGAIKSETNGNASRVNGLKRELDLDDASSVPTSDANTPASIPDTAKRVKFENGGSSSGAAKIDLNLKNEDVDSDEDEEFEDAV